MFKNDVKFILRIGSVHNGGTRRYKHCLNFASFELFDIKLWFIFIHEHSKPEQIDIQL